jgi:hypothetical protein
MAGDVTYKVIVDYATKGSLKAELPQMTGHATALGSALRGGRGEASAFGEALRGAGTMARDAFTGAMERVGAVVRTLGTMAIGAGIGAAIYGVTHLNTELEQTSLSLAAIFNAQGYTHNFTDAMGLAGDQVAKMKQDVKTLPGDLGQLAAIMTTIATPSAQAGASPDEIRKLAGRSMLVGQILGVDQATTAREMAQLLSGRAGAHNILGTRLGFVGGAAKELNADSPAKRMAEVNAQLAKFGPAAEAFGHSWVSIFTTFKDDIKYSLLAPATSPLFEAVKKSMVDADGWMTANQRQVGNFVGRLGNGLAWAWHKGVEEVELWWPAIQKFASDAYGEISGVWQRIRPEVEAIGRTIRESLGDGTALKHLESALKLYARIKIGGALSPFTQPLIGGIGSMFRGGAGAAMGSEGAAAAGGGGIAAALAVPLAIAGTVVAGEMIALANGNKEAAHAAGTVASAFAKVTDDVTSGNTAFSKFLQSVGTEGTEEVGKFLQGLHGILDFGDTMKQWRDVMDDRDQLADEAELRNGMHQESRDQAAERIARRRFKNSWSRDTYSPDRDDDLTFPSAGMGAAAAAKAEGAEKPKTAPTTNTTINNYFTISSNHEPSRIARDVVDKIADMRRHPVQSRHVKNPSGTT